MKRAEVDTPDIRKYSKEYTVLVVEDVLEERKLLNDMLKELGVTCLSVASGEAALNLLKQRTVDMMLLDIALGHGISGLELGYRVKRDPRHKETPIAAVTAYSEDKMTALQEIGFDGYLPKPYTLLQLNELLNVYFWEPEFFESLSENETVSERNVEHF